jgi:hypothetical protein
MAHVTVDLSLAVNDLPACACLGKMLVLMLAIWLIPAGEEVDCLISLAAMLYIDRLITRNMIFDANAILLALYFANVHSHIRAVSTHRAYSGLVDGMFLCWAMGSVVLIAEPKAVKTIMERRARTTRLGPVLLMLFVISAVAHFQAPLEPGGVRAGRAAVFTLLSFAWIYIVGIHTPRGIEYLKENSCQFVAQLSPVLYVSLWIAVAFSLAATAGLTVQYMRLTASAPKPNEPPPPPVAVVVVPADPPSSSQPSPETDPSPEQLSELFRLARMQQQQLGPRPLETIRETP